MQRSHEIATATINKCIQRLKPIFHKNKIDDFSLAYHTILQECYPASWGRTELVEAAANEVIYKEGLN